jgi:hypothetical protein
MKTNYVKEAQFLISEGISVIPLKVDGSKLPKIKWKEYQTRLMSEKEIIEYCFECGGLAGITGSVSNLLCLDFDLDKQLLSQNYWAMFMAEVPKELKKKMLVNRTRSGGYHIWMRVDFTDKSRKLTHRLFTIPELSNTYNDAIIAGADPEKVSNMLLNKPLKCIIESRFEGSYGVISHSSYDRVYGKRIQKFERNEVEQLFEIAYSLDVGFKKRSVYVGDVNNYKEIIRYNEDTSAEDVAEMLIGTGLYKLNSDDGARIKLFRVGSGNPYSSVVYKDTGNVFDFSTSNVFNDSKESHTPFETLCAVKNITEEEGIKFLKEKLAQ